MKATLAMIACLAMAGFLTAATVEGNNTAVVIQKGKVQASTGWQFLCVPVDGLAISGAKASGVDISTFLPPDSCNSDTEVYVLKANGTKPSTHTFKLTNKAWAVGSGTSDMVVEGSNTVLKPGAILWVLDGNNVQLAAEGDESAPATPITFCGQIRTRTAQERPSGVKKMTAMRNDGTTAITLRNVIRDGDTPQDGDQVLLIVNGRNDYQRYYYSNDNWWDGNTTLSNDKAIQPGEAFYYYSRN